MVSLPGQGIVIDGELGDWDLTSPLRLDKKTCHMRNGYVRNDRDLMGLLYSSFDDEYLYFAIKVTDDTVQGPFVGHEVWRNDGVELWLDCRLDSATPDMSAEADDYQIAMCFTTGGNPGPAPTFRVYRNRKDVHVYAASRIAARRTSDGYVLELALPVEGLTGLEAKTGTVIGLNVTLCDSQGSGLNRLMWSGGRVGDPRQFGFLTFGKIEPARLSAVIDRTKKIRGGTPAQELRKAGQKQPHKGPPQILAVAKNAATVGRFEKLELTVDLRAEFDNPYDPEDVCLQGVFTSPSGRSVTVDGFYYQDYKLFLGYKDSDGQTAIGEPTWKVRFTPTELGTYTFGLNVHDGKGRRAEGRADRFTCVASDRHGFLRVSKRDRRYVAFDDGTPFFSIGYGAHLWSPSPIDILKHKHLVSQLACFGGNTMSVNFQTLANSPFDLETPQTGLGRYCQRNAYKVDYLLETARRRSVHILPCLVQTATAYSKHWRGCRFNAAKGGPCKAPEEFFTNEQARKLTKQRLRYCVARWGYSPNLLGWELFNEVNYTDGFQKDIGSVRTWHREMARYLKLIDANRHMVSTSFGSADKCEDDEIWRMPEIHFAITHHYTQDAASVRHRQRRKAVFGKPILGGEFGMNLPAVSGAYLFDREGTFLHNGLWASAMSHSAGNVLFWWQHRYHDSLDLYEHFRAFARYAEDVPWTTAGFKAVELPARRPTKQTERYDGVVDTAPAWEKPKDQMYVIDQGLVWAAKAQVDARSTTQPQQVETPDRRVVDSVPAMLFGSNRPEFRGGLLLSIECPSKTTVDIPVRAVEKIGTRMEFIRNGAVVRSLAVADRDGKDNPNADELKYVVTLPLETGRNLVAVSNTGAGWVRLGQIVVHDLMSSAWEKNAIVFGLQGRSLILLWFHNARNTWYLRWKDPKPLSPIEGIEVHLTEVADGPYDVEWWDTYRGKIDRREVLRASDKGLTLRPPTFTKDLACKIRTKD